MKKIILILLFLLLLMITGCSSSTNENQSITSSENHETEETEIVYEKGVTEDGVYTCNALNIKFTPTEDMVLATEEEMMALYENGAELFKDNEAYNNVDFNSFDIIYEMGASNILTGSNIQIMAEKVTLSNLTPKQYINATFAQVGEVGVYEVIDKSEIEDYELCGVNYSKGTVHVNYSGYDLSQTFLCTNSADRLFCIIITSMQDGDEDVFLDCFSPAK